MDEIRRTIREQEPARPSTRLSTMLGADLTTIAKHRKVEPPRLIHLVRGDLDWIVMKALEKDRTRRYETANGLAMDIQRHLNNEPVVARPPSKFYLAGKFVRRHQVGVASGGVVGLALILGLSVALGELTRARQAEGREKKERQRAEQLRATAEESASQNRQRLIRANVASGVKLLEQGDSFGSLPWFVEALEAGPGRCAARSD